MLQLIIFEVLQKYNSKVNVGINIQIVKYDNFILVYLMTFTM